MAYLRSPGFRASYGGHPSPASSRSEGWYRYGVMRKGATPRMSPSSASPRESRRTSRFVRHRGRLESRSSSPGCERRCCYQQHQANGLNRQVGGHPLHTAQHTSTSSYGRARIGELMHAIADASGPHQQHEDKVASGFLDDIRTTNGCVLVSVRCPAGNPVHPMKYRCFDLFSIWSGHCLHQDAGPAFSAGSHTPNRQTGPWRVQRSRPARRAHQPSTCVEHQTREALAR